MNIEGEFEAVILAKTRMGSNVCVGAATADGQLLRLIDAESPKYHSWRSFDARVGQIVALRGHKARDIVPPHVEDYLVQSWRNTGLVLRDTASWIRKRCRVWKGGRNAIFDGRIRFRPSGSGCVPRVQRYLPRSSVGFWELPDDLSRTDEARYKLWGSEPLSVKYVGCAPPKDVIPKGTLVRLSLSRWWSPPSGDEPEACWLQLSGWY